MITNCPFEKKFPSVLKKDDVFFMSLAYNQALEAWSNGETPIGAIAVLGDEVIASSHNAVISLNDPTAHAEMIVMTKAASIIGDWRLNDIKLYVTKEPCPMCSGATIMSRVGEVIFSVKDTKMGCLGSAFSLQNLPYVNHRPIIRSGIMEQECLQLLQTFFESKRKQK